MDALWLVCVGAVRRTFVRVRRHRRTDAERELSDVATGPAPTTPATESQTDRPVRGDVTGDTATTRYPLCRTVPGLGSVLTTELL